MEGIVLTAQTRSQCCCYWLVCLFVPLLVLVSGCGGEPEVESEPVNDNGTLYGIN